MEQKFYICKHCGNIIAKVKDTGVPVICCGEPMSEIIPGTTDAAVEKHCLLYTSPFLPMTSLSSPMTERVRRRR